MHRRRERKWISQCLLQQQSFESFANEEEEARQGALLPPGLQGDDEEFRRVIGVNENG